jgi:hypothetical protein
MEDKNLNKNAVSEEEVQDSTTVDKTDADKSEKVVAEETTKKESETQSLEPSDLKEEKEKQISKPETEVSEDQSKTEAKVEEPKAEEAKAEESEIKEEPKAEEIKTEESEVKEEPKAEKIKVEESEVKEEPKAEEVKDSSGKKEEKPESSSDEDDDEDETEEVEEINYHEFEAEDLVDKLEELIDNEKIHKIKNRVSQIRIAFDTQMKNLKQEAEDKFQSEEENEGEFSFEYPKVREKFYEVFNKYKQKNAEHKVNIEKKKVENLEKKNEILDKLRDLINSGESLKATYDKFQELQEEWKQIGIIPRNKTEEVWNNYHFLIGKFFEKVEISKELRDLDMQKNLEAKIELASQTEDLLLEKSVNKAFKKLQELHNKWKSLGPAPKGKEEELWERFKTATEKIHERRKEFYEEIEKQQKDNLLLKTDLCEKAEAVLKDYSNIREWGHATKTIQNLFNEWRKIGPVPKKYNDSIWDRFKSTMNSFYQSKKEFFGKLKDERTENLNKKIAICEKAEALSESTDWNKTKFDLINLQKDWKNIGPLPPKDSDAVWKRFRAANDKFFERMDEHFKSQKEEEVNNYQAKLDLIAKIKDYKFGDDNKENLDKIKEFQKEWLDIGFVPRNKHKKLQTDYRAVIDESLEKLKINPAELQNIQLKSKLDSAEDNKEANRMAQGEIRSLRTKIAAIKSEILQWENNMSFFSNSKNAEVLKKEFEDKIAKAKKEVETLKAKVRFLDNYSKKNQ